MKSKYLSSLNINNTGDFGKKYKTQLITYCDSQGLKYEGYSLAANGTIRLYTSTKVNISDIIQPTKDAKIILKKGADVSNFGNPVEWQKETRTDRKITITNKKLNNMKTETLKETLSADIKLSMQNKDQKLTGALRLIKAAIETAEKAEGRVGEVDWMKILLTESKKRQQAADSYKEAGPVAKERLDQELYEKELIESFLPEKQTEEDTLKHLTLLKDELGYTNIKDMGKLIKEFQTRFPGLQDGAIVSKLAKTILV